jgi:hypothetical protein
MTKVASDLGFCSDCGKPITPDYPYRLCRDCDDRRKAIRFTTEREKESAWRRAKPTQRAVVRVLQACAIISVLLWGLEPSYYKFLRHPFAIAVLIGAALACYFSIRKANGLQDDIRTTSKSSTAR